MYKVLIKESQSKGKKATVTRHTKNLANMNEQISDYGNS
jgi:hypothetical protein